MTIADVKRSQLTSAYANNAGGSVAFIDESFLGPAFDVVTTAAPFYLLTAYIVPVPSLDSMRDDLPEVVGADYWHSTKAHQSDDGRACILDFAEYIGEGNESIIVALRQPIGDDDTDGETARETCMRALLGSLESGEHCPQISLAVFEERKHQTQRNSDEMILKRARADELISRSFHVLPMSPTYERLLWLPDVVSFALYQSYGSVRDDYARPFRDRVKTISA